MDYRWLMSPPGGLARAWARAHSRRRAEEEHRDFVENFGTFFRSAHFEHPDDSESDGGLGVREPRRPKPSGPSDGTALPELEL